MRPRREVLFLLAIVGLGSAFLFEMVTLNAVPVARDIQLFFLPHKKILWSALQGGELPLWTSLIGTGYPVLANFQSGVFYPPHWLYGLLPLLPAFNVLVVFHFTVGGAGVYLLGRKLEFERPAALIAATTFMLGGYLVSLTNLVNHLQTAVWAPLMVLVVLRHVDQWRVGTFVQALIVYLLAFLAGAPQTFLLASALALFVTLVWKSGRSGGDSGSPLRAVITMVALAVAVAGLTAVQTLPTIEMIDRSTRAGGLSMEAAGRYSISPVRMIHLIFPNSYSDPVYQYGQKMQLADGDPWLYSVYLGIGALALAWHARWDRTRRRLVVLWVGLALVGVLLALGPYLPFFPWLHANIPGLASFRYPAKFFLLAGVAMPMLAGHGTSALLKRPGPDFLDSGAALLVLCGGLGVKLIWPLAPGYVHTLLGSVAPGAPALDNFGFAYVTWEQELEVLLGVLAVTVAVILFYRKSWLTGQVFVTVMAIIVAVDLWLAHRSLNPTVDPSFYREEPLLLGELPVEKLRRTHRWRATPFDENAGGYYDYRLPVMSAKWFWQHSMQPNTAVLWGVQADGASDAIQLSSVATRQWLLGELPDERRVRLLRLGSVSHVYSALPESELENARIVKSDTVPGLIHVLKDPLPRVYLAHPRSYSRQVDALNAALDPTTDYHREVAIWAPDTEAAEEPADIRREEVRGTTDSTTRRVAHDTLERPEDPGSARVVQDQGEVVRIGVDADQASYLVLTDTWYPGWTAYVDGERTRIRRANHFFRGVPVEPDDREVVFRYEPASLRTGAFISSGSTLMLIVGLVGWRWRRRRWEA